MKKYRIISENGYLFLVDHDDKKIPNQISLVIESVVEDLIRVEVKYYLEPKRINFTKKNGAIGLMILQGSLGESTSFNKSIEESEFDLIHHLQE
jgi:hypothetical protein